MQVGYRVLCRYRRQRDESTLLQITWVNRDRLTDRDALDVEDQVRVGGNVRGRTLLAVCERSGDGEATFTTGGHTCDTDVPALDDLADTELEGEWLALLVGYTVLVLRLLERNGVTHSQKPCRS
jgi:hypothetical protein